MEEKDQEELEDLLFEARDEAKKARLTKGNQQFLILIAIIALINFILFPFDYARIKTDTPEALGAVLLIQGVILSGASMAISVLVSLLKFSPWTYLDRLYRSFLFFYSLSLIFLLLILILNLARFRFHLFG
ncbi:MAG: hypothetical protein R8P61_30485 [Bacteroidia bacterium]|nr:hypothetical protein [Bacteroidia bacterium]